MSTLKLEVNKVESDLIYDKPIVYDYGWQDNAAGMRFSNYYGFGVVDAGELVKAAQKCSDDPVCVAMASPSETYTSTNESPCRYGERVPGDESEPGENNIVCTFSGFKNSDEQGKVLGEDQITIDAVTFDFFGFAYDADKQVYSKCKKLASPTIEELLEGVSYANAVLQIEMISPSGTVSLVKPIYANWGYANVLNKKYDDDEDDDDSESTSFQMSTSSFYLEKFRDDPEHPFTIRIKTACNIDLNNLNKYMKVSVFGRK